MGYVLFHLIKMLFQLKLLYFSNITVLIMLKDPCEAKGKKLATTPHQYIQISKPDSDSVFILDHAECGE